jgi:lipopolysaccharide/colanic/teichoic acid biosynthesis glycosyltransferase
MIQVPFVTKTIVESSPTPKREQIERVEQAPVGTRVRDSIKPQYSKILLDYLLVIPTIIAVLPLLLIIALAVRLSSPGPVIYRRRVLGKGGREFDAFKFRTMFINGDEILARYPRLKAELDENYKLKCDPRVTSVGKLLRKYSLDELPQLFNVLFQQMSLVGPRIIAPHEISKYGKYGDKLMTVTPGITGLWQVSGRSDIVYDDRVQLDMTYIDNWSIWLDLKILLQTPLIVLRGDGAY